MKCDNPLIIIQDYLQNLSDFNTNYLNSHDSRPENIRSKLKELLTQMIPMMRQQATALFATYGYAYLIDRNVSFGILDSQDFRKFLNLANFDVFERNKVNPVNLKHFSELVKIDVNPSEILMFKLSL